MRDEVPCHESWPPIVPARHALPDLPEDQLSGARGIAMGLALAAAVWLLLAAIWWVI